MPKLLQFVSGNRLRARLVRGAFGTGGLKLIALPVTLLTTALLARGLGPEAFGQYAFLMSLITVLSVPIDRGIKNLVTREVANLSHSEQWTAYAGLTHWAYRRVLWGAAIIAAIPMPFIAANATWTIDDRWTLLLIALSLLPFIGLNALYGARLRGHGYVVLAQIPELLVRPTLHLVVAALLVTLGYLTTPTALLSQTIAALVGALLAVYFLTSRISAKNEAQRNAVSDPRWTRAWISFTFLAGISVLNNQIGVLLLGWLSTDSETAALRIASRGAAIVTFSLASVNLVIAPYITQAYHEGDIKRLQALSRQSARAAVAVSLPVCIIIIAFSGSLVGFVFGSEYINQTVGPLTLLTVAQLINVALGSVGVLLLMSDFEKDVLMAQIVAVVINVAVAVILIPSLGAMGAAYGAAAALIMWNAILAIQVLRRLKIRPGPV